MQDSEIAATLMSLSAPDERQTSSRLYMNESQWKQQKKESYQAFSLFPCSPPRSTHHEPLYHQARAENHAAFSLLSTRIQQTPLTSMIPRKDSSDSDDVDMLSVPSEPKSWSSSTYLSPFDGLVAAARDQETQDYEFESSKTSTTSTPNRPSTNSSSSPIMIPLHSGTSKGSHVGTSFRQMRKPRKDSFSREGSPYLLHDSSPTGVEDDNMWFESYRHSDEFKRRARLGSACLSEGGISEYGGLGRKHLEEFIRMEISAVEENEGASSLSSSYEGKYIGSYSPSARKKRIERFLEKRKRRIWAKKVDYDVRKNFANSRLRVKGRFVKKEDEELLCQLMSFT